MNVSFVNNLNLSGNTLGPRGVKELRDGIAMVSYDELTQTYGGLRMLNLRDTMLGDAGGYEVAKLIAINIPTLVRLNISDNNIGDDGMCSILQALQQNTHLQMVIC
uniref:RAN GTPase-activating protein 2 n=1 Tax=Lygus hesperus TaxID=30085 RepID=A0A0A9YQ06_LYGHE